MSRVVSGAWHKTHLLGGSCIWLVFLVTGRGEWEQELQHYLAPRVSHHHSYKCLLVKCECEKLLHIYVVMAQRARVTKNVRHMVESVIWDNVVFDLGRRWEGEGESSCVVAILWCPFHANGSGLTGTSSQQQHQQ